VVVEVVWKRFVRFRKTFGGCFTRVAIKGGLFVFKVDWTRRCSGDIIRRGLLYYLLRHFLLLVAFY
jgi:hypothetical protein